MKTEAGYLRDVLIHRANTSPEQFASADDDPESRTPEALLAIPRYVAMQLRYVSHNICLEIADWSVIVEYLKDIQWLDDKYGRYGKLNKRVPLMAQVKVLLDAMQQKKYRTFFGVVALLPEWKPGVVVSEVSSFGSYLDTLLKVSTPEAQRLCRLQGWLRLHIVSQHRSHCT